MGDVPAIPGPVRYPVIPAARVSNRRRCGTGAPEAPPPFPTHSMVLASHWPMFVPVVAAPPFCLRHASLCPAFRTHRLVRCDVTAAPSLRSLGGTAVRQTAEAVEVVAAILEQGVGPDAVEGARSPSLAAMAAPLGTGTFTEETGQEKQDTQEKDKAIPPERAEEAKLKAKYPNLGQKPGGSDFLMKRLQKGQKYFDSGDYNMAKAKMKNKQLPSAGPDKNLVTGDHIPTPQDLPQRKSSLVTSKLAG